MPQEPKTAARQNRARIPKILSSICQQLADKHLQLRPTFREN